MPPFGARTRIILGEKGVGKARKKNIEAPAAYDGRDEVLNPQTQPPAGRNVHNHLVCHRESIYYGSASACVVEQWGRREEGRMFLGKNIHLHSKRISRRQYVQTAAKESSQFMMVYDGFI